MIKETFDALKSLGVSDEHTMNLVVALEKEHREHREAMHKLQLDTTLALQGFRTEMHSIQRDMTVLKWMVGLLYAFVPLLTTILFRLSGR